MSSQMLDKNRYSLNEISHNSAMLLIRKALQNGFNISEVYLDTVGGTESYENKLSCHFNGYNIRFIVESKADVNYPIVSAASICAKVMRDYIIDHWIFNEKHLSNQPEIHQQLGNGYPGDEKTKKFLQTYKDPVFGFPTIVRFSWQTAKTIMDNDSVNVKWADEQAINNLSAFGFLSNNNKFNRAPFYKKII